MKKNILLALLILLCAGNAYAAIGGSSTGSSTAPIDDLYIKELLFSGGTERVSGSSDEFIDFDDSGDGTIAFGGYGGSYDQFIDMILDSPVGARLSAHFDQNILQIDSPLRINKDIYVRGMIFDNGYGFQSPEFGTVMLNNNNLVIPSGYRLSGGTENEFLGKIPGAEARIKIFTQGTSTLTDGSAQTVVGYIDATPAGEWTASDATNCIVNTSTNHYKLDAGSLWVVVGASTAAGVTITNPLAGGNQDWTNNENFGFWFITDTALTAGDCDLRIVDSGAGNTDVDFPAVEPNKWTWVRIDISGVANASKDVITDIAIVLTVDKGRWQFYADNMVKFDSADRVTLTQNILTDGCYSVLSCLADGSAIAWTAKTEWTNYFIDYGSTDYIVPITDEDANNWIINYAYQ